MRTLSAAQLTALFSQTRRIETRVYVGRADGQTWVDLTRCPDGRGGYADRVAEVTIDEDQDRRTKQLVLGLLEDAGLPSLSPEDQESPLNWFSDTFDPLLSPVRECQVWQAITDGRPPKEGEFELVFHGYLGSDIGVNAETGFLELTVNDLAKRLQTAVILEAKTYAEGTPAALETIMQAIIDDQLGAGVVTLYCPVSPAVLRQDVTVAENGSTWDALQTLADSIGWDLRYRYDEGTGEFRLILSEPPRSTDMGNPLSASLALPDGWPLNEVTNTSDAALRNYVVVRYYDQATGDEGTVVRENVVSRDAYWRRPSLLTGNETFPVRDSTAAGILADAVLYDLQDPDRTTEITCDLLPWVDIHDVLRLGRNRVRSAPVNVAVYGYSHTLRQGEWTTTIQARGKVTGATLRWLAMERRPGSPALPPDLPDTRVVPLAPANLRKVADGLENVGQDTLAYLDLAWDPVTNITCDQYLLRYRKTGTAYWETLTVPRGTDSAPQRIGQLPGNVDYDLQAAGVSRAGVQGVWSQTLQVKTPKDTQAPATPTGLAVEAHKLGVKARWNPNTEPDLAGYRVQYRLDGGTWTTVFVGTDTERLVQADPGVLVEFQLRAEDTSENASAYSSIQGATAQALDGGDYGDGTVDTVHIVQDAITALEVIEINDATGTSTSSTSFVDIPGYSITFTLSEEASCIINMSLWAACENQDVNDPSTTVFAWFRTLLDGVELSASRRTIGVMAPRYDPEFGDYLPLGIYGSVAYNATRLLQAGQHTIKAQFHQLGGEHVTVYHRVLSVTIFKR